MSKYNKGEKRQIALIILCVLVYTVSYISRYSYNSNIVVIQDRFNLGATDTGLVGTFYFAAYGIGQVVHGLFCKRYNKKIVIPLVLFVSAVINAVLFFEPPFYIYKYLWLVNGFALSVLWSSLVYILSSTLDEKFIDLSITAMALPVALGTCVSYGSSALFKLIGNYLYSFLLGAIAPLIVVVIWLFSYDKLTENAKNRRNAEKQNKSSELNNNEDESNAHMKKKKIAASVLFLFIIIGLFAVANNLIKDGLNTWVPSILKESYGFDESLSMILTLVLPVFGMFGAVLSVFMNRKIIKDFVLLDGLFYLLTSLFLGLIILALVLKWSAVFIVVFFGIISLLAHSINCLNTAVAPLKMRDSFNSGTVAGIFNGCAYAGSAISGYALGSLKDATNGWIAVFWLLFGISVFSSLLTVVYTGYNSINTKLAKKQ